MKRRQLAKLLRKALYSEIGFSGQGPSVIDEPFIRKYGRLHPRHRGVLRDFIEAEKAKRRECFRQACVEVLGEDPETDWS